MTSRYQVIPTMKGIFLLSEEKIQETVDEILLSATGDDSGSFEVAEKPHRDGRWPIQKRNEDDIEVWGTYPTREEAEIEVNHRNLELRSRWEENVRQSVVELDGWVYQGLVSGMSRLNNGTSWTWIEVKKEGETFFHVMKHAGARFEYTPVTGEEFLAFQACLEELVAKLSLNPVVQDSNDG